MMAAMNAEKIDQLLADRTIDDGGCLVWQGRTCGGNVPAPKWKKYSLRRMVFERFHGPLKKSDLITFTCGNSLCLEYEHLKKTTRRMVSKIASQTEYNRRIKLEKGTIAARANGKITMEIARYIRASEKNGQELANELNISKSLVSRVRLNKAWQENIIGNPFAGLFTGLAANDSFKRRA